MIKRNSKYKILYILIILFIIVLGSIFIYDYIKYFIVRNSNESIKNNNFKINKKLITKTEAIKEINLLKIMIDQFHPEPFIFRPKEYVDAIYEEKIKQIKKYPDKSLSIVDFAQIVEEIINSYKDYHIFFFNNFAKDYCKDKKFFPINVFIDNKKNAYFFSSPDSDYAKYNGLRILTINGEKISSIIDKLENLTNIYNPESSYYLLSKYYNFSYYLYKLWGEVKNYKIEYEDKENNQTKELVVAAKKITKGNISLNLSIPDNFQKVYSDNYYEIYVDKKINTFLIKFYNLFSSDKFISDYNKIISLIEEYKTKNVIIDNRFNTGGNSSYTFDLLRLFVEFDYRIADFQLIQIVKLVNTKLIPLNEYFSFAQYENYKIKQILNKFVGKENKNKENNLIIFDKYCLISSKNSYDFIDCNENNLINKVRVKIFVLQGPGTFSAGSLMSYYVKRYKLGYVIGGKSASFNIETGDPVPYTLPYSNLTIYLPCSLCSYDKYPSELHPLPLDYEINPTIEDYLNNYDRVLDFTIKLIEEKRNKTK